LSVLSVAVSSEKVASRYIIMTKIEDY